MRVAIFVGCSSSSFLSVSCIACLYPELLAPVHSCLRNVLVQLYVYLINLVPSNLRLESKQLVLEFLQDALSNKMSQCCGAG